MELLEQELKKGRKSQNSESLKKSQDNPLLSRNTSKGPLTPNFDDLFLYLHSLVELNFSKL